MGEKSERGCSRAQTGSEEDKEGQFFLGKHADVMISLNESKGQSWFKVKVEVG